MLKRCYNKLSEIKDSIYDYFLSLKDAFLYNSDPKSKRMTFSMFNLFLKKICSYGRKDLPNFSNTKDLFECIDIKKDGVIDLMEWLVTFRQIDKEKD